MPKSSKLNMPKMPMMSKSFMMNGLIMVGVVVLILYILRKYGMLKNLKTETMSGNKKGNKKQVSNNSNTVMPASENGNEQYATVRGGNQNASNGKGLPPSCSNQPVANPSELLPNDANSEWAKLNPSGSGDLQNVNLLSAGALIGIDTVGNSLRNANLQVRSEPANPQMNVGPWNNTTISPDTMRVPLELGQGAQ